MIVRKPDPRPGDVCWIEFYTAEELAEPAEWVYFQSEAQALASDWESRCDERGQLYARVQLFYRNIMVRSLR